MKVIGGEQIWDLADFTWKFDRNLSSASRTATNGYLCARETKGGSIYSMGCQGDLTRDYYYVPTLY
jgi:hypothetical protein